MDEQIARALAELEQNECSYVTEPTAIDDALAQSSVTWMSAYKIIRSQ